MLRRKIFDRRQWEPDRKMPGSAIMRVTICLPLLTLLAACGSEEGGGRQPDMVSNIVDGDVPGRTKAGPAFNAGETAQAPSVAETPPPSAMSAGSIPASLQGQWAGMSERCGDRAADLELTIQPGRLIFHESVGTVQSVAEGDEGGVRVTAAFTGEGQSWTRTLDLRPSPDGGRLTIINDGNATTRKRC